MLTEVPFREAVRVVTLFAGMAATLMLKVAGSDDTETFTLEKDKPADLFKCK